MIDPATDAELATFIALYRRDQFTALREGDAERARDCRLLIAGFEHFREHLELRLPPLTLVNR